MVGCSILILSDDFFARVIIPLYFLHKLFLGMTVAKWGACNQKLALVAVY